MVTSWAITECTPKVLNKFIVTGLLDDRAGLEESYEILKYVVDEIKLNQQGNQ